VKLVKILIIFIIIFSFTGCAEVAKKESLRPIQKPTVRTTNRRIPAIREVLVSSKNFYVQDAKIPNHTKIKRVKIMGASLTDVISLLTEATQESIVFQLESQTEDINRDNNNNDYNNQNGSEILTNSNVYLSASNIGIGTLLEKAVGNRLGISYEDNAYYLGDTKNITLKIPAIDGLGKSLVTSLDTFGANKVVYDPVTSSISFSAKSKEYKEIMHYLEILRDNLYVIEYSMEIYSVQLNDEHALGIDWEAVPSTTNSTGFIVQGLTQGLVASTPYKFGIIKQSSDYQSASAILNILEKFGKVESIQRPKLLGLAGTSVTLKDGTEEAYIKSLQTTLVSNGGAQTSTVSGTALSGLDITLNSNIIDDTVISNINIKINDIVGYTSFNVDNKEYKQPKISTKEIKNTVRVKPGVPIVISGLYRQKNDTGHKGIPKTSGTILNNIAGSDYKSATKSEMVIIVTPRLIKYVIK